MSRRTMRPSASPTEIGSCATTGSRVAIALHGSSNDTPRRMARRMSPSVRRPKRCLPVAHATSAPVPAMSSLAIASVIDALGETTILSKCSAVSESFIVSTHFCRRRYDMLPRSVCWLVREYRHFDAAVKQTKACLRESSCVFVSRRLLGNREHLQFNRPPEILDPSHVGEPASHRS